MSRVLRFTVFKQRAKPTLLIYRRIHTSNIDSVKLSEVQNAVHTISKESQPSFKFSKLPVSKISEKIKASMIEKLLKSQLAMANSVSLINMLVSPMISGFFVL